MKILVPDKLHRAHMLACTAAGKRSRIVAVLDHAEMEFSAVPVCLASADCRHCDGLLRRLTHVNLGMMRFSEIEVDRVTLAEAPAPAPAEEFPP